MPLNDHHLSRRIGARFAHLVTALDQMDAEVAAIIEVLQADGYTEGGTH